ncbi:MAG: glycoside hydrolase family 3 C-terminal domain-containing protein, partial [Clostridia bacterium]|nr:glycoside hydrolase family 3 C-terminal domain-containing protein [Clostridia bacterium]
AEAVAKEISACGDTFGCYPVPPFTSGSGDGHFGSESVLAFGCGSAYVKGFEKNGKLAAYPYLSNVDFLRAEEISAWLKGGLSQGIAVDSLTDVHADFARYKGVIYQKNAPPLCLGPNENLSSAMKKRAKECACAGITAGAAFDSESVKALNAGQLKEFAGRIEKLKFSLAEKADTEAAFSDESAKIALRAAKESVVLLKNDGLLPISPSVKNAAVIGGCAVLAGEEGLPLGVETPLERLRYEAGKKMSFRFFPCAEGSDEFEREQAIAAAERFDITLLFVGEKDHAKMQTDKKEAFFIRKLIKTAKKAVVIFLCSPEDVSPYEEADALIVAWKPCNFTGRALSKLLTCESPTGRLPYPIISGERAGGFYPFGYGLGYGSVEIKTAVKFGGTVEFYAENASMEKITETVQIYRETLGGYNLAAFTKIALSPAQMRLETLKLPRGADINEKLVISSCHPSSPLARVTAVINGDKTQ